MHYKQDICRVKYINIMHYKHNLSRIEYNDIMYLMLSLFQYSQLILLNSKAMSMYRALQKSCYIFIFIN